MPYPLPTRSAALEPPRSVMPRSNAQQSWARQRYSSFFHGESVVASTPSTSFRTSPRKSNKTSRCSFRARIEESNPTLRSPTSTRSLIDPVSPPLTTYSPITSDEFAQFQRRDHPNPPPLVHTRPRRTSGDLRRAERHLERAIDRSRRRQGRRRTNTVNKAGKTRRRKCFPAVRNPKIRRKIFGSLISAMILSILLIIYLTLTISSSLHNKKTLSIILIVLILITTIITSHYIIRLVMLARRARRRHRHNNTRAQRFCTLDTVQAAEGYANPQTPIPVILQRDEELGLHHSHVDDDDDDDLYGNNDDEQEEIHIPPPPPPAYGLWRSSVRADPNLLHWQARSPEMIQKHPQTPSSSTYSSHCSHSSSSILHREGLPRPPRYTMEEGSSASSDSGAMDVPVLFFADERV